MYGIQRKAKGHNREKVGGGGATILLFLYIEKVRAEWSRAAFERLRRGTLCLRQVTSLAGKMCLA